MGRFKAAFVNLANQPGFNFLNLAGFAERLSPKYRPVKPPPPDAWREKPPRQLE
jgi:hypothetical protein